MGQSKKKEEPLPVITLTQQKRDSRREDFYLH